MVCKDEIARARAVAGTLAAVGTKAAVANEAAEAPWLAAAPSFAHAALGRGRVGRASTEEKKILSQF